MGRAWLVVTVVLAILCLAPVTVTAAVVYRIRLEPAAPRVGERVTVIVATLYPASGSETASEPQPLDAFPWTFVAESSAGDRHEIGLERLGSSPNEWTGTFTFDRPGRWEVGLDRKHLGTPIDPSLGARLTVDVRGADDPLVLLVPPALAVVGLLLAGAAFLAWHRRSSLPGATDEAASQIRLPAVDP